jgi:hypothetical protein
VLSDEHHAYTNDYEFPQDKQSRLNACPRDNERGWITIRRVIKCFEVLLRFLIRFNAGRVLNVAECYCVIAVELDSGAVQDSK